MAACLHQHLDPQLARTQVRNTLTPKIKLQLKCQTSEPLEPLQQGPILCLNIQNYTVQDDAQATCTSMQGTKYLRTETKYQAK